MSDKIVALQLSLLTSVKLCVFVLDHLVLSELILARLIQMLVELNEHSSGSLTHMSYSKTPGAHGVGTTKYMYGYDGQERCAMMRGLLPQTLVCMCVSGRATPPGHAMT
jgi:hypothetical protein